MAAIRHIAVFWRVRERNTVRHLFHDEVVARMQGENLAIHFYQGDVHVVDKFQSFERVVRLDVLGTVEHVLRKVENLVADNHTVMTARKHHTLGIVDFEMLDKVVLLAEDVVPDGLVTVTFQRGVVAPFPDHLRAVLSIDDGDNLDRNVKLLLRQHIEHVGRHLDNVVSFGDILQRFSCP